MALPRILKVSVAVTAVTLGLAGCAGLKERTAEEAVKARSQERWDALVKGDIETAYRYLSPGSRAVVDLESYRATIKRGFWKAARVQAVECGSPDACDASAEIEYEYRGSRIKTPLKESWVRQEKDWWYVLK